MDWRMPYLKQHVVPRAGKPFGDGDQFLLCLVNGEEIKIQQVEKVTCDKQKISIAENILHTLGIKQTW